MKNHTNVVVSCFYRTPGSPIDTCCENMNLSLIDVEFIKIIFVWCLYRFAKTSDP